MVFILETRLRSNALRGGGTGRGLTLLERSGEAMLTLRLTDILLLILVGIACVGSIYAINLIRGMSAVLADWRKTAAKLDEVLPHVQRLCVTTEEAMRSVKVLADQGNRVAGDVADVTDELKEVVQQGMARVQGLYSAFDAVAVLMSSFKTGLAAVQALRERDDDVSDPDEGPSEETDDEERDV